MCEERPDLAGTAERDYEENTKHELWARAVSTAEFLKNLGPRIAMQDQTDKACSGKMFSDAQCGLVDAQVPDKCSKLRSRPWSAYFVYGSSGRHVDSFVPAIRPNTVCRDVDRKQTFKVTRGHIVKSNSRPRGICRTIPR